MAENATSWLPEDHSWRKTTRHVKGGECVRQTFFYSVLSPAF
jgi:hypothetical protein